MNLMKLRFSRKSLCQGRKSSFEIHQIHRKFIGISSLGFRQTCSFLMVSSSPDRKSKGAPDVSTPPCPRTMPTGAAYGNHTLQAFQHRVRTPSQSRAVAVAPDRCPRHRPLSRGRPSTPRTHVTARLVRVACIVRRVRTNSAKSSTSGRNVDTNVETSRPQSSTECRRRSTRAS